MNASTRFRASYTDGETARIHEVEVRLAPYQITLHQTQTGQLLATWPVSTLVVDKSMAPHVRITSKTAGDAALSVDDPGFKQAFAEITTGIRDQERSRYFQFAVLLGSVAAIGALIWLSLTPVSGIIARKIPFSWEQKLGGQFKAAFVKDSCESDELGPVLTRLKDSVQGPTKLPLDFEIVVANDLSVNAFALPGGVIILNRGLLKKAKSSDEIAGVLAHEFQHVIRRHITAKLIRGAILTAIWSFTVGDFSGVLVVDPHTIYQVASLKFDRDAEAEADHGAIAMLDKAKISRKGFVEFFARLKDEGPNVPSILSTHPASDDRIAMIENTKGPVKTHPALSDRDWEILQTACGTDDTDADDTEDAD